MADINEVPLVDVMRVLLVIFIITAPLLTNAVKIDLPRASSQPNVNRPEHIELGIRAGGELFWNDAPVTLAELPARRALEAKQPTPPELHLLSNRQGLHDLVAQVMSLAAQACLKRIGFVTDPV